MRTLISASNFSKARNAGGQIATLLLLLITVILILVMITANIGSVAVDSTVIANAADAAVLQLGSNLATKAKMLYEGLGSTYEKCQKRGWLSMVLAIIVAIIITIICWGSCSAVGAALIAAAGGAAAGAIGAAIQGTSILQGAAMGAAIGAAIGSIGAGLQNLAAGGGWGTAVETSAGVFEQAWVPTTFASGYGTVAFGALGVASSVYNASTQYQIPSDAAAQLEKDLAKLNEYDRFRESAFFTALKQVADDPTKHLDEDDIDANEKEGELIPRFAWWWHRRMLRFEEVRNQQIPLVNAFINDMKAFRNFIAPTYLGSSRQEYQPVEVTTTDPESGGVITYVDWQPVTVHDAGMLERLDYKWSIETSGENAGMEKAIPGPSDGSIVYFLRPMASFGYPTSCLATVGGPCWQAGPSPESINSWLDEDCNGEDCSLAPAEYDGIDATADQLRSMVNFIDVLAPQSFELWFAAQTGGMSPSEFSGSGELRAQYDDMAASANPGQNWEDWRNYFYDFDENPGNDPDTYYAQLGNWIAYLQELRSKIVAMNPPNCVNGWTQDDGTCGDCNPHAPWVWYQCGEYWEWIMGPQCGNCIRTPPGWPCKLVAEGCMSGSGITVDANADDEQRVAINDIDTLIAEMTNFRNRIKDWSEAMNGVAEAMINDLGGLNPITYRWTDSRGYNRVTVQAGPYRMPYIKTEKHGNWLKGKVCSVLKEHTDGDRCWIRVTKYPPSNVEMGPLGRFNPFMRGITKVGKAYYSVGSVGLKDIQK